MPRRRAIVVAPSFSSWLNRCTSAALMIGWRLLYTPRALAAAMPSSRRSRRKLVSNSANTPSRSRNALPAAVAVSTGCSVAFSLAPFAFQLVHDVLQVLHRSGEPVDASDHQCVAVIQEIEQHLELGAPVAAPCRRPSRRK